MESKFRKLIITKVYGYNVLQQFSSDTNGQIKLALLETNNLIIYNGAVIYVCDYITG